MSVCDVCGRAKWEYSGSARSKQNCMQDFAWAPDDNLRDCYRLGYERLSVAMAEPRAGKSLRWSWKCSLCGVSGPRTLEAMNDHLLSCEKRPQSAEDALAAALEEALRAMGAAREMLGVFEDNGGHDGLSGKGYMATLDQIDTAKRAAQSALRAIGRIP